MEGWTRLFDHVLELPSPQTLLLASVLLLVGGLSFYYAGSLHFYSDLEIPLPFFGNPGTMLRGLLNFDRYPAVAGPM